MYTIAGCPFKVGYGATAPEAMEWNERPLRATPDWQLIGLRICGTTDGKGLASAGKGGLGLVVIVVADPFGRVAQSYRDVSGTLRRMPAPPGPSNR
jgi:hypothetical protein